MALTPEEQKELAELEELEQLEAMEAREQNYAPTQAEMDQARAEHPATTGEALSAGFIEGIPFLKDAVSAVDGISDAMQDDDVSFDTAYSNYKDKLDETNQDLNAVEAESPYAFGAGEIAGTAGAFAAGGAALKGAGAGAALTPLGMGVVSGTGVGAVSQLSRSEDRSATDLLIGGGMGAAGEVGAHYLMKGVKKGGKYLMDKADDIGGRAVKKILGMESVSSQKQLYKHLKRTNQKESKFLNDVLTKKMKDGDELVLNFNDKPERMLDKIKIRKSEMGEEIGSLYKKVDLEHKVEIDVNQMKDSLKDDVVSVFANSDDPGMQKIGSQLDEYISKIGQRSKGIKKEITEKDGVKLIEDIVIDEKWGLTRVHQLQKDIRKRIEKIYKANGLDLSAAKEQQKKVATSLGRHMDEVLESVSSEADDVIKSVKKKRIEFGNMATVEDAVEAQLHRVKDDPVQVLKEALSFRSVAISGAAASAVGPAGLVVGPMINRVVASPKTPLYLAKGLKGIAHVVQAAPTGKIATRINAAAAFNNDRFKQELYGLVAETNLTNEPLPRTAAGVLERVQDIRHYIKSNQPSMLQDFDSVIETESQSAIGGFMDGLSKIEGTSKFFEQGVGFDGKVYNEQDKETLQRQLKMADIPAAQRIQMLNALRSEGLVPDFNAVVIPEPKQHVPKTRKMEDY